MRTIEHWVGGKPHEGVSDRFAPVWNPASGEQQARVRLATQADVEAAVSCASEAFGSWSQTPLSRRVKVLFAFRDAVSARLSTIAAAICDEHGKVIADAEAEVRRGLEVVEYACGIPSLLKGEYSDQVTSGVDLFSFREPLGVVAGITPFNFPAMVPMWMFPLAIACGNTFVLKPSERDPTAALLLASCWADAGLPSGVFNVVHGDRTAVDALLDHPQVAAISFVGSTPVARYVYERGVLAGKRVQALGGAKNHAVVLDDADPAFVADQLAGAAFGSAGERCMAVAAAVAVGGIADRLLEAVHHQAARLKVGPGRDPASEMGPVITREAQQRITGLVAASRAEGARVVVDGCDLVVPGCESGFFVGPTVLDGVTQAMRVYREEVFGPVLCVLRAQSLNEAIEVINSNPYGNGTALFTGSGTAAREFQRRVKVGMIGVNVPIPVPLAYYSFGGWKASLFGSSHIHGPEGVAFYTRAKVVTSRWSGIGSAGSAGYFFPSAT